MPATTGMYTRAQFEKQQGRSKLAADTIIPLVLQATGAKSVVDVGCGVGAWLAACQRLGITDVLGIDGEHVDADLLQIPRQHFRTADLREPLTFDRCYDLALSVEVAEHLPPESGPALVKELTNAAPAVLFSAAIPGQTGPGHINERWQSYWVDLFASHGYLAVDEIRPAIWSLDEIPFWYRQNVILYLRRDRLRGSYSPPAMVDVVHPELFRRYVEMAKEERYVSGRKAASILAKSMGNRLLRMTSPFSNRG